MPGFACESPAQPGSSNRGSDSAQGLPLDSSTRYAVLGGAQHLNVRLLSPVSKGGPFLRMPSLRREGGSILRMHPGAFEQGVRERG